MATDPFRFKLGLFVVSGFSLAVAGFFAVSAGQYFTEAYPVYFYFEDSVQGLERDAAVTYRGVKIGSVKSIGMHRQPEGPEGDEHQPAVIPVVAEIDPERLGVGVEDFFASQQAFEERMYDLVADGLRVKLQWGDITGAKYLEFDYYSGAEAAVERSGSFKVQMPWVPTVKAASFDDIQRDLANTLGALSRVKYEAIGDSVLGMVDNMSAKVDALDTEGFSNRANETLDTARALVQRPEIERAIERLDTISANLESTAKRIDALAAKEEWARIGDDAAAATASLRRLAEDLEQRVPAIVKRIDELVEKATAALDETKLAETTAAIRDAAVDVGGAARSMGSMRDDLRRALADLSKAGRSVARLTRAIEERPKSLLSGERSRREVE